MILLFAFTLFVSAFLLFLVQPMVGKMILPTFGGTPAVWNSCMVFFQAALLAGYAYAHGSVGRLGVRRQAGLHLVLLAAPILLSIPLIATVLPITIDTSAVPTQQDYPILWLLGRLVLGVGLPFFVVATNAPVLQMWFSKTGHASAKDPYFLYGASNLGSLLALLGYPLVIEPWLAVDEQSMLWAWMYGLYVILALACAVVMWRESGLGARGSGLGAWDTEVEPRTPEPGPRLSDRRESHFLTDSLDGETLTFGRRLYWVALAFVPSSLMLGVTTHVTTEIAPVPLLWVAPLALYLLTFVLVFARKPLLPHAWVMRCFPFIIVPVAFMTVQWDAKLGVLPLPFHLVAFFAAAMACHGELAKDRPSTAHLTQFYLLMSVGGVLGGLFNAVVAPLVFEKIAEYPLVMVGACIVVARGRWRGAGLRKQVLDVAVPLVVGVGTAFFFQALWKLGYWPEVRPTLLSVGVPALVCWMMIGRRLRFGLTVASVVLATMMWSRVVSDPVLYEGRNFYGAKQVVSIRDDQFRIFTHGRTIHGIQRTHPDWQETPMTYFHREGPVGDVFATFNIRPATNKVAIVGLGIGSMASYVRPGQHFTFYEIDPEVARIAADPDLFTFLENCGDKCSVVLGDGRLTLADAPDGSFGAMFLDAFSSDAVPTHLLTREALQLYISKLHERGILVFNVSNRYIDLAPVLANLADDAGWVCLYRADAADSQRAKDAGQFPSKFVVMARRLQYIRKLDIDPEWMEVPVQPSVGVWTDRFSNIFRIMSFEGN